MSKPIVLLGAGGHASVLLALLRALGKEIIGVCDPLLEQRSLSEWDDLLILGGDNALSDFDTSAIELVNGVGQVVGSKARMQLHMAMKARGFRFATLVHPAAWVSTNALLGEGAQIMAGAIIQPHSKIGEGTIINTRAGVDHDCIVGEHAHVAPGATLCGTVHVGAGAFIGAGATVIQGISIGKNALIGAGHVVRKNVADNQRLTFAGSDAS